MKKNEKLGIQPPPNTPTLLRLYRLIKSMTVKQKRDIRKKLQFLEDPGEKVKGNKSKTTSGDLQLFDAINRFIIDTKELEGLQKYMERNHLGNRTMLSERASDLYDCILEGLRSTPDRGHKLNRLNSLMQDINTLYHKNLRSDCMVLVLEARKIAREIDKPIYLLELLWWQMLLQPIETERYKVSAAIDSIKTEQAQIIRHLVYTSGLRNTLRIVSAESRQMDASLDVVPDHLRALLEMKINEALPLIAGPRAKMFFLSIIRPFGIISSKIYPEQRQYWLEKMVEAYETLLTAYQDELAVFAKEDPANSYWGALENHITLCRMLNKEDRAEELMEIFEKEADTHILVYSYLNKYLNNRDSAGAIKYIEKANLLLEFDQFREVLSESRQTIICYQCGFVYFLEKKWDKAQKWFAIVMDGHRPDHHHIAVTVIGLLDILCTVELKAYGGSVIRIFENFEGRQKRAGQWNQFLKSLTDILKNHLSEYNDHDIPERLAPLCAQASQHKLLNWYGVVLAWIEARLNKTDYLTELKKYN